MANEFNGIPIVRLELQHAQRAIMAAIQPELLKLDEDIRTAVQQAVSPENIRQILRHAVQTTLRTAIEREVTDYFSYSSEGQKRLKKAVADLLSRQQFEI